MKNTINETKIRTGGIFQTNYSEWLNTRLALYVNPTVKIRTYVRLGYSAVCECEKGKVPRIHKNAMKQRNTRGRNALGEILYAIFKSPRPYH